MRKYTTPQPMTVEYLVSTSSTHRLGDHPSLSLRTSLGSELRYRDASRRDKPWREIRYSWTAGQTTTPAYTLPQFTFTGQRSYLDDPSTSGVEGFGLMDYNARWYDPSLGRFAQADTIVPTQTQGVQAWDRFAFVNNNPVRYNDPTGHCIFCILFPFVLSAIGVTPDYVGIATTMAFTDTDNAVTAAGLAVQSQYPWAIVGGNGKGLAQLTSAEMKEFGMEGQNPYSPSVAVTGMEARIQNALEECTSCTTGYDRLIVAAIAQNGSVQGLDNFRDLPIDDRTNTIDWDTFLTNPKIGNSGDPFAQLRADIRNEQYSTLFMLRLYTQDLRVLMKLGYKLPDGITEDDVKYIEDHFLSK